MTFDDFQNLARLYVIGALYPQELAAFQAGQAKFGERARTFLDECYGLRDAFALSLRPINAVDTLKRRLLSRGRAATA